MPKGNTEMRPFTPDEIPKIMKAFEGKNFEYRNKSLIALGVSTGFRIAELTALRLNDIVYMEDIKDQVKLPKRMMKGNQPRHPKKIYPETKTLLRTWIAEMKELYDIHPRSHLFMSLRGTGILPGSCWGIIKRAAKRAGIPAYNIGTHSLRKTFANEVYDYWDKLAREENRRIDPMRMTQLELGHASIDDTYSYMSFQLEAKPDDVFAKYNFLFHETDEEPSEEPESVII